MEQRTMMHFFIFKRLNPYDIFTKLLSVYGNNALNLSKVNKRHRFFADKRIELCDNPRSGQPLHHNLVEILGAMYVKCHFTPYKKHCVHFMIAKATFLCILYKVLHLENLIHVRFRILWTTIQKPKEWYFRTDCLKSWRKIKRIIFIIF
jgi:hypothetical protein